MVASAGRGSTTSWMAVGLKLAEEGLIQLFLRYNSTLHKLAIDDRVIKNTQQSAIHGGCNCNNGSHSNKEDQEEAGHGAGQQ
jgi:hypothetical protein